MAKTIAHVITAMLVGSVAGRFPFPVLPRASPRHPATMEPSCRGWRAGAEHPPERGGGQSHRGGERRERHAAEREKRLPQYGAQLLGGCTRPRGALVEDVRHRLPVRAPEETRWPAPAEPWWSLPHHRHVLLGGNVLRLAQHAGVQRERREPEHHDPPARLRPGPVLGAAARPAPLRTRRSLAARRQ